MPKEEKLPFGISKTKRFVSPGAERALFDIREIGKHGEVELVDYLGGDDSVERVATMGHGRNIFPERPNQLEFLRFLVNHGIYEPFKFVQLKFSIQSPIETALAFVYEPSANVNEYSGRYSKMLETAEPGMVKVPTKYIKKTKEALEWAQNVTDTLNRHRNNLYQHYLKLLELDMARELARAGLGIDNDTRYYWKMNLFDLSQFVKKQKKMSHVVRRVGNYLDEVEDLAFLAAPNSWRVLMNDEPGSLELSMPHDEEVINSPLSPPSWGSNETKRVVVPALEERLFTIDRFLDHGEFQIVDYMGDDSSFAQAARTSYGEGTKTLQDDKNLVRSLIRDLHTTPIEMSEIVFESKAPVFSDPRQLGRHRTLEHHGFMGYTPIGIQYYFPQDSEFRYQDRVNRQGRGKEMEQEDKERAKKHLMAMFEETIKGVRDLESLHAVDWLMREMKGVGFYTKRSRTGDAHNIGRCLVLRLDQGAQMEIREQAKCIDGALELHTPAAREALYVYHINGMRLSEKEIDLITKGGLFNKEIDPDSLETYKGVGFVVKDKETGEQRLSREGADFQRKLRRLLGYDI